MKPWRFDWLTRWDEIWSPDFQNAWLQTLMGFECNHVFFHRALVRAWFETPRASVAISPRFLVATDDSLRASVLLPLVKIEGGWRHLRQRVLAPVGMFEFDYHDPLTSRDIPERSKALFWQTFAGGLRESWYGRDVDRVTIPRLRRRWSCPIGPHRPPNGAPYIDMAEIRHIDTLLAGLGQRYRESVKRKLRRARQDYTVRMDVIDADANGFSADLLGRFYRLRTERWPRTLEPIEFFDNLVRHGSESGVMHFSILRFDEDIVSYHLGFWFRRVFYWYIPVYEPRVARHSPGLIHLLYLLEWCIDRSCTRFDFLVGMESYKQHWASGLDEVSAFTHDNPRLMSRCKNRGRGAVQSLKSRLRRD